MEDFTIAAQQFELVCGDDFSHEFAVRCSVTGAPDFADMTGREVPADESSLIDNLFRLQKSTDSTSLEVLSRLCAGVQRMGPGGSPGTAAGSN